MKLRSGNTRTAKQPPLRDLPNLVHLRRPLGASDIRGDNSESSSPKAFGSRLLTLPSTPSHWTASAQVSPVWTPLNITVPSGFDSYTNTSSICHLVLSSGLDDSRAIGCRLFRSTSVPLLHSLELRQICSSFFLDRFRPTACNTHVTYRVRDSVLERYVKYLCRSDVVQNYWCKQFILHHEANFFI
jgi:hypothetical protein